MVANEFNILLTKTLLYYEIFDHPLTVKELYYLFPRNSIAKGEFAARLDHAIDQRSLTKHSGYLQLVSTERDLGSLRLERSLLATKRMRIAKFMSLLIKRFPFVRAIFLSGDLSKGVAHKESDIDYVIVTAPHRLWICRTMLMLFKKLFLLNSKKYFCLNYYVAEDDLHLGDHNYFTATEVVHLKPLYDVTHYLRYLNANSWIKSYFPNFMAFAFTDNNVNSHRSILQRILEIPFAGRWADRLDHWLMETMKHVWRRRYPQFDAATHARIFRCTPTESSAYVGNYSDNILTRYEQKLDAHSLRQVD